MNEAHDLKGTESASSNTRVLLSSASVQTVGIRELPVFNDTDYFLLGHRVMHGHHQAKDVDIGVLEVQVDRTTGSMDSVHKPCTSINLLAGASARVASVLPRTVLPQ